MIADEKVTEQHRRFGAAFGLPLSHISKLKKGKVNLMKTFKVNGKEYVAKSGNR